MWGDRFPDHGYGATLTDIHELKDWMSTIGSKAKLIGKVPKGKQYQPAAGGEGRKHGLLGEVWGGCVSKQHLNWTGDPTGDKHTQKA